MLSTHYFLLFLCVTSGLWMKAHAQDEKKEEEEEDDDDEGQCCKSCPDGWTAHSENCYMFHFDQKTWGDAERACTLIGGNLASLQEKGVHAFLRDGIERVTGKLTSTWVGGHDAAKEKVWMWTNGGKFDFHGWFKGEPNNSGGNENCMEMNFNGQDYINDADCAQKKSYVCAKKMEETSE